MLGWLGSDLFLFLFLVCWLTHVALLNDIAIILFRNTRIPCNSLGGDSSQILVLVLVLTKTLRHHHAELLPPIHKVKNAEIQRMPACLSVCRVVYPTRVVARFVVNHHSQPRLLCFHSHLPCGWWWGWSSHSYSIIDLGLGLEEN